MNRWHTWNKNTLNMILKCLIGTEFIIDEAFLTKHFVYIKENWVTVSSISSQGMLHSKAFLRSIKNLET